MATKRIKVVYDAELCYSEGGKYVAFDDIIEQPSLKDLYNKAKFIIKKCYSNEYKNGRRFYVRNIERIEFRVIDTAAKEIRVKLCKCHTKHMLF